MAVLTPMIEQYWEIKNQHQDAILFFRLGDFYEMFYEDAKLAARELEIVLTARGSGENKIPMCGVPYHSANNYIARLINRGHKIAICEQLENPGESKGIVKREVVKIISPGTVMDDSMLEENKNNYLAAIIEEKGVIGFAYIDISTAEFRVTEFSGLDAFARMESELLRLSPAECLIADSAGSLLSVLEENWRMTLNTLVNRIEEEMDMERARTILLRHFAVASLEGFGLKDFSSGIKSAASIIEFLKNTQKQKLEYIQNIRPYRQESFLEIDYYSYRNLELSTSIREGKRDGSLLSILDSCCTSMGKRGLKKWLEQPLRDIEEIHRRLDSVEEIKNDIALRNELQKVLDSIYDLERIAGKIGSGLANPRDLLALKLSLTAVADLQAVLGKCQSFILRTMAKIDTVEEVRELIENAINDEAPLTIKEGNIFKAAYNKEIDELREMSRQGSSWLINFEQQEKERTGIKYLKIGFNKVFGYYIEISKSNLHMAPADYVRKQTLVNTERFICDELKKYEEKILGARERLFSLEYEEFLDIRDSINQYIARIQKTAQDIAYLDVLYSLAETAYANDYVRPRLDHSGRIEIKGGRHPVVEKALLASSRFVPNDLKMDKAKYRFAIITGPNMGGKSTFMRQTALIVIMAQMGSFIPADSARIGLVDKIFTRVGAADDLAAGQSTFMVEMLEVANILNNASEDSLIILDEIGRGTSTYDGLSIARSVSEYILKRTRAKTLFATHYHELTALTEKNEGIQNLSVSVKESGDTVIFLKKVLQGKADKSYGIHVARLAGLPAEVIQRAEEILEELEKKPEKKESVFQGRLFEAEEPVISELQKLDLDRVSPRDALMLLYQWKEIVNNR